jgi:integrase
MKTPRRQYGVVYQASDSFFVRYWITKDGARKRVSTFLCKVDKKHHSTTCKPVQDLCADFMKTVNDGVTLTHSAVDIPITEYWSKVYLPFVEGCKKPSTVIGYKQIWEQFLSDHLADRMLREYNTVDATNFLTNLVKDGYGRRTVAHVKSLGSGVFKHAKATGKTINNPWTGAISLIRTADPVDTPSYTLIELMDVVNNKLTRTDARLVICLAGLMGLRPSEIVGLCWEDVNLDGGRVRIRQAIVRGHLGTTKTGVDESLPMIEPLLGFMKAWHKECDEPSTGWVFQNQHHDPINMGRYVRTVLKPAIGKGWKSLYAFRRGAASILTQLTGSPIAASQLLRHKNISVTMTAYIKADRTALVDGLKMLETKITVEK